MLNTFYTNISTIGWIFFNLLFYFTFSYKAGYFSAPEVHHVYVSPPVKYVEYVEKPVYIEKIVPKPIYKPHIEYDGPVWSQPDTSYG